MPRKSSKSRKSGKSGKSKRRRNASENEEETQVIEEQKQPAVIPDREDETDDEHKNKKPKTVGDSDDDEDQEREEEEGEEKEDKAPTAPLSPTQPAVDDADVPEPPKPISQVEPPKPAPESPKPPVVEPPKPLPQLPSAPPSAGNAKRFLQALQQHQQQQPVQPDAVAAAAAFVKEVKAYVQGPHECELVPIDIKVTHEVQKIADNKNVTRSIVVNNVAIKYSDKAKRATMYTGVCPIRCGVKFEMGGMEDMLTHLRKVHANVEMSGPFDGTCFHPSCESCDSKLIFFDELDTHVCPAVISKLSKPCPYCGCNIIPQHKNHLLAFDFHNTISNHKHGCCAYINYLLEGTKMIQAKFDSFESLVETILSDSKTIGEAKVPNKKKNSELIEECLKKFISRHCVVPGEDVSPEKRITYKLDHVDDGGEDSEVSNESGYFTSISSSTVMLTRVKKTKQCVVCIHHDSSKCEGSGDKAVERACLSFTEFIMGLASSFTSQGILAAALLSQRCLFRNLFSPRAQDGVNVLLDELCKPRIIPEDLFGMSSIRSPLDLINPAYSPITIKLPPQLFYERAPTRDLCQRLSQGRISFEVAK